MEARFKELFYSNMCDVYDKVKVLGENEVPIDCQSFINGWKSEVRDAD